MKEVEQNQSEDLLSIDEACVFIHSRFCGTCHLARKMLETVEVLWDKRIFYELNASFFPDFLQTHKIKSVPCLLIIQHGKIREKIYAFYSVPYLHQQLSIYYKK